MKLLLDQNLSPRLVDRLSDVYPNSNHVQCIGLACAQDEVIWNYARDHGYLLVTKDVDFSERSIIQGFPPKVIWIRRGNCSTQDIENILRQHTDKIRELNQDPETGVLTLF